MPDYRLRQIPSAPWRIVQRKAGDRLQEGLRRLIELWAEGTVDPLTMGDPIRSAFAAQGARALNASRTPEERRAAARRAVQARWAKHHAIQPRTDP